MAYIDNNTPVIEQITLPSGNSYYIADREIRDVVDALSQTVAGGVSYIVAWDGTSAPTVGNIPAGVVVTYEGTDYTGTMLANNATPGAFYLIKSTTQVNGKDAYDEYVPVGSEGNKTWEKIGDTQIELSDVVTNVTLTKQTDTVIGTDATFTITQPTVALSTGATAGTGVISVATGISSVTQPTVALSEESTTDTGRVAYTKSVNTTKASAAASGGDVAWNSKDSKTVLTGVQVTAQPTVTLTANNASDTGRITYLESQGSATTTKIKATASGGGVAWNSKDSVTAITGVTDTTTKIKATADITGKTGSAASSVTPTTKKLATTTVTGVSGSTNITPIESRTSQTTADGTGTASTTNTDWLKGVSVSNGVLTIGAATMDTQTTYSAGAPRASLAVPTAASSATTVATGATTTTGSGADIVTDVAVGDTVTVVTAAPTVTISSGSTGDVTVMTGTTTTDDTVIGTDATLTHTNPTVTISSGTTGDVTVATGINAGTTKYLSAAASGTTVGSNGTASVIGANSTFTVTQPSVTLSTGSTGDITIATGGTTKYMAAAASGTAVTPTTTNIKATASGANTAWNSKDAVTVLKNTTDLSVTKGGTTPDADNTSY